MKQKWILPVCVAAGVLLVCAAALFIAAGVISEKGFSITEGTLYLEDDRVWLIEKTGGAISVSDRTKGKDLFRYSVSGDRVLVLHDWLLETYPAQTGAYWIWCLKQGNGSYRPDDTTLGRVDIGWHDRSSYLLDTMTDWDFQANCIRTDGYHENISYPQLHLIRSVDQLQAYCMENRSLFQLEQGTDGLESFLEFCSRYDEAYFEKQCLLLVLLQEGSGSIRHKVDRVGTVDGETVISIQTIKPEVGTCDMAQWHILIEPGVEIPEGEVVTVLLDETIAVNPERTVTYSNRQGSITLDLPAGWASTVTETGDDFSVAIWPEQYVDGKICIRYFSGGFGVCGTGLSTKPIQLGAYSGSQGTYDNTKPWSFISFPATHGNYAILNERAEIWWDAYGREAMRILENLTIED